MSAEEYVNDIDDEELAQDIDYSDLEEKYAVSAANGFEKYIVVDGAPIAPESKVAILTKVLKKLFSSVGSINGEEGFYMPLKEGKTQGFFFVEYEEAAMADAAIKQLNGKKLDQKHRLFVNRLSDVEKYGAEGRVPDEFKEPVVPPFKETDYLKSWLQDFNGRDQFVLQYGETVGVFWNKKNDQPEKTIEPRLNWTSTQTKWSPKGLLLFSVHPQGIQAWGGPNFESAKRFSHPNVRLFDFSPCEKYLVTLSPEPIISPPEDHPNRASFPFGPESEGHKLVIWDLATGLVSRTFALPPHLEGQKSMPWPLIKWSHDDKYFARMGPSALAIYETATFSLLDKKMVKIDDIIDFEWAPTGVQLANYKKTPEGEHVLAYWTPESVNQTARVALMHVPTKQVIRTVNLFQVSDCKLHWQDEGRFLCVKVDRHTKSKKTLFSNLEFFKVTEKDIPVEKLELKETVVNFGWEPKSERFITISRIENGTANPAIPRNTISFYAPEIPQKGTQVAAKYVCFKKIENRHSNGIYWSPKGRFVVISTITGSNREIEFFDVNYDGEKKDQEKVNVDGNVKSLGIQKFYGITDIAWDPSGRYVATWSSVWIHEIENGYKVYDIAGHLLFEDSVDHFKAFDWRPRPASLLSAADRKKVRKNLREYSAQFDEFDAMEADAATREAILLRRRLLEEWRSYRNKVKSELSELFTENPDDFVKEEVIHEIKEEIVDEKEEIVD